MSNGWIKLHRKFIECSFFNNPNLSHFWIWCLLKATHEEYEAVIGYQKIFLKPGEFIFGRNKAAEETGLSVRNVRTCLVCLTKIGNLTIKTTNKFSIINICKWEPYQNYNIENDHQNDQQLTNKRPTTDHIQEHKEHKEVNTARVSRFEQFWTKYPKKEGKATALRHFLRTVKTDSDWKNFKIATETYLTKLKTEATEYQYIKQASTFVNNWKDWLEYKQPEQTRINI